MPIYEYRCDKGHTLEVLQRMSDDRLSSCSTCGAPVQRVFHPVAVHFKGSGFYTTDYGQKKDKDAKDAAPSSDSKSSDKKGSDSKSSDSKSSESKSSESKSKASASSSDSS